MAITRRGRDEDKVQVTTARVRSVRYNQVFANNEQGDPQPERGVIEQAVVRADQILTNLGSLNSQLEMLGDRLLGSQPEADKGAGDNGSPAGSANTLHAMLSALDVRVNRLADQVTRLNAL